MIVKNLPQRDIRWYSDIVGEDEVNRVLELADNIKSYSITHVNSTSFGGGVAELLQSLIPLFKSLGINAMWEVIEAPQEFFKVTKKIHNALQGKELTLKAEEWSLYLNVNKENAEKILKLNSEVIIVHDPQPLPIRRFSIDERLWIWRCHIDLSNPYEHVFSMILDLLKDYDASIYHMREFIHPQIPTPKKYVMPPSIDPLSDKNKHISESIIERIVSKYGVSPDNPIILQVSRYDPWKDPFSVIDVYRLIKKKIPNVQLVLIGALAHDDPEGLTYYEMVKKYASNDRDIYILTNMDGVGALEVNAFQRAATVILQMSIKEGFGLSVTEALWKGKPVVARPSGGIKLQVIDGVTGFLVRSVSEAYEKTLYLIKNPDVRLRLGRNARVHVLNNFIITKHLIRYMKILNEVYAKV